MKGRRGSRRAREIAKDVIDDGHWEGVGEGGPVRTHDGSRGEGMLEPCCRGSRVNHQEEAKSLDGKGSREPKRGCAPCTAGLSLLLSPPPKEDV